MVVLGDLDSGGRSLDCKSPCYWPERPKRVIDASCLLTSSCSTPTLSSSTMLAVSHPVAVPDPSVVPSNAPDHCPGVDSELAGKADACAGCANQDICATNKPAGPDPALPLIRARMANVRRKILVLSGKGGVGKSTFCAQLAWAFAADEESQVRPI